VLIPQLVPNLSEQRDELSRRASPSRVHRADRIAIFAFLPASRFAFASAAKLTRSSTSDSEVRCGQLLHPCRRVLSARDDRNGARYRRLRLPRLVRIIGAINIQPQIEHETLYMHRGRPVTSEARKSVGSVFLAAHSAEINGFTRMPPAAIKCTHKTPRIAELINGREEEKGGGGGGERGGELISRRGVRLCRKC